MIPSNKIDVLNWNPAVVTDDSLKNQSRATYYWYLGSICTFALIFFIWQYEPIPLDVHLTGVIVVAIATYPIFRWWNKNRGRAPLFEILCLSYGLQHGAIMYFGPNEVRLLRGKQSLTWDSTRYALIISAIGILALCIGYFRTNESRLLRVLPKINLELDGRRQNWYFLVAIILGFLGTGVTTLGIVKSTDSTGQWIYLFQTQLSIVVFLLTLRIKNQQAGRAWKMALYGLLTMMVLYGLSKGMLEDIMTPLVVYIVARWHSDKRPPLRLISFMIIVFLILQPIKQEYRVQAWRDGQSTALSLTERASIWIDVFKNTLFSTETQASRIEDDSTRAQIIGRLDLLHIEAHVLESTPDTVPYFYGGTYSYLAVAFIPRIIWPSKPEAQDANKVFVLAYGFLNEELIQYTIMGIGHIAEAYANFGVIGVILIMLLQGSIFSMFARVLNGEESQGGVAIYTIIMITFLNGIGSATAGLFGGIVQLAVADAVILLPFVTLKAKSSQPALEG